jgi:hypothetical protein
VIPGLWLIEWTAALSPILLMLLAGAVRRATGNAWVSVAMAFALLLATLGQFLTKERSR